VERVQAVVVGAGQAGLAVSHELAAAGVEHLLLERGGVGETWRRRWKSFCLVTPNWSVQLPGFPYDGDDPDGFMGRDEIVAYLERYAASFGAPLRLGVQVDVVRRASDDDFVLFTSAGTVRARALVVSTGAYQRTHRVPGSEGLPAGVPALHLSEYHDPGSLPPGPVLVVGSGQSGCQVAEELRRAGREVTLSCGRAPWFPRRWAGKDLVWWLVESGFLEAPVAALPTLAARLLSNPLATGHDGGHDLHLRTLQEIGVTLTGRFLGTRGLEAVFAPDLAASVAWGDDRYRELMDLFLRTARAKGLQAQAAPDPPPFDAAAPERLDLARFGAVLFTCGFRPDYATWLPWPEAFDPLGFPLQQDGESEAVPGLYFAGVHFLRKRKSALLIGVGEDATVVARRVASRLQPKTSRGRRRSA
jgi:putative flavoprotein involved in K+ transport